MIALTRRQFVALGASGLFVIAGGGIALRALAQKSPRTISAPKSNSLPPNSTESTFTPKEIAALPLPLWLTPNENFYRVQYAEIPSVSLTSWSLTIYGKVQREEKFSFDEIRALPALTRMHTLECIGNPVGGNLIGNADWRGISLRDLLQRAGIAPDARWVVIGGVDEYFTSIPIERALHEHALLAYEMNGATLPLEHGFPLRAILPGVYGQKQPKWITSLYVTDTEALGHWEQKGWSREAAIQLNSGIKMPRESIPIARGDILIAGVAHASEIGVRSVEMSTDGGATWDQTILTRAPSPFVWTPWGYLWKNVAPGNYELRARATDNAGNAQPARGPALLRDVYPNGANAIHSILVQVSEA